MRLLAALLIAGLAWPLAAQPTGSAAKPDTTLPSVSVVATRTATPTADAPARITVLDAEDIAATASASVADLLEARASAFVKRYGPSGLASLSLRGTGSAQTLVLLDGQRIADPQLGQLDLSLLPTVLLDRVEIMHGPASALYGTDGIGGVVDLRTARADGEEVRLTSEVGAYGERAASGLAAARFGSSGFVVAAEARASDGDFSYFDPNADVAGSWRQREGADRSVRSLYARVETERRSTTASAAVWIGAAERGLPGTVGGRPQDERQDDRHVRAWGEMTTRLGPVAVRTGGLFQRSSLRYLNPALALDDTGQTTLGSGEIEARALVGRRWMLAGGITAGIGQAEHPSLAEDATETRLGAFVHGTGDYGRVLIYPALRADTYLRPASGERTVSALSPRLGVNLQPLATPDVRIKASAGTAFRAPTFNDRFWQPGGNPNLRPERGWTADAGVHAQRGDVTAELTFFASRLRDQIVWQPTEAGYYAPENLSRTRTLGIEATASHTGVRLGAARLGGGLTYALTDARDRSNPEASPYDQQLRYVPRHAVKGFADVRLPLGVATSVALNLGGRFTGARPVRSDGSLDMPASFVLDARLRVEHRFPHVTAALTLAIENALDTEHEIVRGYPMPPRHLRARLHLAL